MRLGLALSVSAGSRGPSDLAEVLDAMPHDGLLVMLDGPDGRVGALALDFALLSALVEMQTVGRVLPRDPDPRPTTRTDAAIVAPLVDDILTRFAADLQPDTEGYWAAGYRFAARVPDVRGLGLLLGAPEYQLLRVPVDIARGLRAGRVVLALPMAVPPPPDPGGDAGQPAPDMAARLWARMLDVPTPLDAVLCRLLLPLAQVRALAVGDVLALPPEAMVTTRLEAAPKRAIAEAQLGHMNGRRALRLRLVAGPTPQALHAGPPPQVANLAMTPQASNLGPTPQASSAGPTPQALHAGPPPQASNSGRSPQPQMAGAGLSPPPASRDAARSVAALPPASATVQHPGDAAMPPAPGSLTDRAADPTGFELPADLFDEFDDAMPQV